MVLAGSYSTLVFCWLTVLLSLPSQPYAQTDGPNMENSPSIQRDSSQLSPWIMSTRVTPTAVRPGLSMYVWTLGWDASEPGCDTTKFLSFDKLADPQCFTHNWDTQQKRYYLWNTVTRQGHTIENIYLSGCHEALKAAYNSQSCISDGVINIRATLSEGHQALSELKIYALFAVSDSAVSEREMVPYVIWYNNHCASRSIERFDGFAVNNEAVPSCAQGRTVDSLRGFLNKLKEITNLAGSAELLTHFSLGVWWGQKCPPESGSLKFSWNGGFLTFNEHAIKIFSSTDIQVATMNSVLVVQRMRLGGYDLAARLNKPVYFNLYTNKVNCNQSFKPEEGCDDIIHSESNMWTVTSQANTQLTSANLCIHYYRGVYSPGGHRWPIIP